MSATKKIVLGVISLSLCGCYSLSGDVRSFSVDYGTAMSYFQNEQLLTNILRASENAPLHFSELGQVNGSLQEQIQIGASIPFGKYTGLSKSADSLSPQVTFASSPTFTTSPLDTQAFTVGLMQPIDASFLVNRLANADAATKELLLMLFVESIDNADQAPKPFDAARHLQNTPTDHAALERYVNTLLTHAEFRLVKVLTPIGPAFHFDPAGSTGYKMTDVLSGADEASVHLAKISDTDYRLFHIWSEQLALCYESVKGPNLRLFTSPALPAAPKGDGLALFLNAFKGHGGGKNNGGGNSGSAGGASPAASGRSGGGGGGAPAAAVATPLMPLVGFVDQDQCFGPIYVERKIETPKADEPAIREFQINLRSIRGAIEYLGALVRANQALMSADGKTTLFSLIKEDTSDQNLPAGILSVKYKKTSYVVADTYTAKTVQIMSELVDSLKLSSDIATTKQVQIIP